MLNETDIYGLERYMWFSHGSRSPEELLRQFSFTCWTRSWMLPEFELESGGSSEPINKTVLSFGRTEAGVFSALVHTHLSHRRYGAHQSGLIIFFWTYRGQDVAC